MRGSIFQHTDMIMEPIRALAYPVTPEDRLDPLIERIGDAQIVLLGEASHGTSEYYTWRARISRRLIEEKGFQFIAVEGDWPDCYEQNRYVKGYMEEDVQARDVLHKFTRWPTWMWANWEIVALAEWMKRHNDQKSGNEKVGFYGLDVYSLWDSLHAVVLHLEKYHPELSGEVREALFCFEPFSSDGQKYAWFTQLTTQDCEYEVVEMLKGLSEARLSSVEDPEAHFNAEQNAHALVGAERYYRTMVRGNPQSWNVRDTHMVDTLDRLINRYGKGTKAIIWEHNTHIGDARATDMQSAGMVNVGQLVRERYGDENAVLVGFTGYHGSVIAGKSWEAEMERMDVPPAIQGSWEWHLHQANAHNQLLILKDFEDIDGFTVPRGHRAIGVVYHPEREAYGNYVPTYLPGRYDALLFFDQTHALHPLHIEPHTAYEAPETYPWGM